MTMRKAGGVLLTVLGLALLVSAFLLFFHNEGQDQRAGEASEELLEEVWGAIQVQENAESIDLPPLPSGEPEAQQEYAAELSREKTMMTRDGYEILGVLRIPALELALPVMAAWDTSRLELAPCRQFGAAETDDLVIAGHNYKAHFRELDKLTDGDVVYFMGVDGIEISYQVAEVSLVMPEDVAAVRDSGFDLVLYTCTQSRGRRVTVFCNRTETPEA